MRLALPRGQTVRNFVEILDEQVCTFLSHFRRTELSLSSLLLVKN